MWAKVKTWIPWVIVALTLAYAVRAQIRQTIAVRSAQSQIEALQTARDKAADLQGEKEINDTVAKARQDAINEASSGSLSDFIDSMLGGDPERKGGD
jgi:hypothetical protein